MAEDSLQKLLTKYAAKSEKFTPETPSWGVSLADTLQLVYGIPRERRQQEKADIASNYQPLSQLISNVQTKAQVDSMMNAADQYTNRASEYPTMSNYENLIGNMAENKKAEWEDFNTSMGQLDTMLNEPYEVNGQEIKLKDMSKEDFTENFFKYNEALGGYDPKMKVITELQSRILDIKNNIGGKSFKWNAGNNTDAVMKDKLGHLEGQLDIALQTAYNNEWVTDEEVASAYDGNMKVYTDNRDTKITNAQKDIKSSTKELRKLKLALAKVEDEGYNAADFKQWGDPENLESLASNPVIAMLMGVKNKDKARDMLLTGISELNNSLYNSERQYEAWGGTTYLGMESKRKAKRPVVLSQERLGMIDFLDDAMKGNPQMKKFAKDYRDRKISDKEYNDFMSGKGKSQASMSAGLTTGYSDGSLTLPVELYDDDKTNDADAQRIFEDRKKKIKNMFSQNAQKDLYDYMNKRGAEADLSKLNERLLKSKNIKTEENNVNPVLVDIRKTFQLAKADYATEVASRSRYPGSGGELDFNEYLLHLSFFDPEGYQGIVAAIGQDIKAPKE